LTLRSINLFVLMHIWAWLHRI